MTRNVSPVVVSATGGTSLVGLVTTVLTLLQNPHDTNSLTSGLILTVSGLLGLVTHYHKQGVTPVANQNDVDAFVERMRTAFTKIVGSPTTQRVEVDISEGLKLLEEVETYAQGITAASQTPSQTSSASTTVDASTEASTEASTASPTSSADFSKLS